MTMKLKSKYMVAVLLFVLAGMIASVAAQSGSYTISGPHSYKNLSIFLIHGRDESSKGNMLTLQEAMERKLFVVYETSDVNKLEVENLSKEFDVFRSEERRVGKECRSR